MNPPVTPSTILVGRREGGREGAAPRDGRRCLGGALGKGVGEGGGEVGEGGSGGSNNFRILTSNGGIVHAAFS